MAVPVISSILRHHTVYMYVRRVTWCHIYVIARQFQEPHVLQYIY